MRENTALNNESDEQFTKSRLPALGARKSRYMVEILQRNDDQTKLMASLVPDEVIYNVDDYSHREYDACFLFGDVSGRDSFLVCTFRSLSAQVLQNYVKNTARPEFRDRRD